MNPDLRIQSPIDGVLLKPRRHGWQDVCIVLGYCLIALALFLLWPEGDEQQLARGDNPAPSGDSLALRGAASTFPENDRPPSTSGRSPTTSNVETPSNTIGAAKEGDALEPAATNPEASNPDATAALELATPPAWVPVPGWPSGPRETRSLYSLIPAPAKLDGLRWWNVEPVAPLAFPRLDTQYGARLQMSYDGQRVAMCVEGLVRVFDRQGQLVNAFLAAGNHRFKACALSAHGAWLATVDNHDRLEIFEVDGDRRIIVSPGANSRQSARRRLYWSPKGDRLLVDSIKILYLVRFDPEKTGTNAAQLSQIESNVTKIESVVWSPDGTRFAAELVGGNPQRNVIAVCDFNGRPLRRITKACRQLRFSHDNSVLYAIHGEATIDVVPLESGIDAETIDLSGVSYFVAHWFPMEDGTSLFIDRTPAERAFDYFQVVRLDADWKPIESDEERPRVLASRGHPSDDGSTAIWRLNSRRMEIVSLSGPRNPATLMRHPFVHFVDWHEPSGRLATAHAAMGIRIWDAELLPVRGWEAHGDAQLTSVRWNRDGMQLLSASGNGDVALWTDEGQLVRMFAGDGNPVWSVEWAASQQQFATVKDDAVCIWNIDGTQASTIKVDSNQEYAAVWHPQKPLLAVSAINVANEPILVCRPDGTIHHQIPSHKGSRMGRVAWSADGRFLAYGHNRLWDDEAMEYVLPGERPEESKAAAWNYDGTEYATYTSRRTTLVTDATNASVASFSWARTDFVALDFVPDGSHLTMAYQTGVVNFFPLVENMQAVQTLVPLPEGRHALFGEGGRLVSDDPSAYENDLLYVCETDAGELLVLSPREFHARFVRGEAGEQPTP